MKVNNPKKNKKKLNKFVVSKEILTYQNLINYFNSIKEKEKYNIFNGFTRKINSKYISIGTLLLILSFIFIFLGIIGHIFNVGAIFCPYLISINLVKFISPIYWRNILIVLQLRFKIYFRPTVKA